MKKDYGVENRKRVLPVPVCEEHAEYKAFYDVAWALAGDHVRDVCGMPQTPYMDEAFCDSQIWIWDTCFMSLFCKYGQEAFPGVESFKNFYEPFYDGKTLPKIIPSENEPEWTGAKPGIPYTIEIHIADNPPLFAWAEYENARLHGDREYLRSLLYDKRYLQKHYERMENLKETTYYPGVRVETFFRKEKYGYKWEGGRSGMDNTPRGRTSVPSPERPNNPNLLWIDAICQQALSAKMISKMFSIVGDGEQAEAWQKKFREKQEIVNAFYWDEEDGFYYDIECEDRSFCKVKTIASYWTMTAGIATEERAKAMVRLLKDPHVFGGEVPFVSLSRDDAEFSPTGKYWRGGVWAPTAYAALKGLAEYGMFDDARELALKLLSHAQKTYEEFEPHTIWETYAPEGHRPACQVNDKTISRPNFCGWSALIPISVYIEFVLGFHTIDAFENVVKWAKPTCFQGKVGIRNLRFGEVVTDIVSDEEKCFVTANAPYTLEIDGKAYPIKAGENEIKL